MAGGRLLGHAGAGDRGDLGGRRWHRHHLPGRARVGADDVRALHASGVEDAAIEEAVYVATMFNVIDRLADAFDFRPNDATGLRWVARILLKVGYGAGSIPG